MGCLLDGSVYRWTRSRGFDFLADGPDNRGGVGISADGGTIVAARSGDIGPLPAIWYGDGSSTDLGFLPGDCNMDHQHDGGLDISADGRIAVGQTATCSAEVAFVWTPAEGLRELPSAWDADSRGNAVSAEGNLVVGYCDHPVDGYPRPAIWRDGNGPTLFMGTEFSGEARNVSPNGMFVVGQADMGGVSPQAFFWTDGAPAIALGNLSGRATDSSLARAVSDDGTVVGWSGDELWGDQEAFIWTRENRMVSLAAYLGARGVKLPEGMVLTAALDISADGNTVVGLGRDKDWKLRYWIAQQGESHEPLPVVRGNPWEPKPMDHEPPDTLSTFPADILNPFPFGKRRF